jgi:hypothetical protein
MLTAACPSLPPYSIAKDRHVLSTARRRDRQPRIALLQSALECEGNCVSKDFSLRHGALEHKENTPFTRPQRFLKKFGLNVAPP